MTMGANAQTSVPTFTTGQVLTAAQQNQINTGVPVFATTTTRDDAFGGTGEKVLAEGQLAYIEASNIVQYYDGSSWATLAPATPGAFVRVGGATFTSQTSVAFANDVFSSTYKSYSVVMTLTAYPATASTITMQLRDNSGTKSSAAYIGAIFGRSDSGSTQGISTSNGTSFSMGSASASGSTSPYSTTFTVYNPTNASHPTSWSGSAVGTANDPRAGLGLGGLYTTAEAHTGLVFSFSVAATGFYNVYGLADS
jgi:hypothetical protein